jgi:IS30 family transposase
VVGAQQSGVIVTLVERRTGYLKARKSCDRRARRVRRKIERMLSPLPAELCQSATFDNGKEFAEHALLEHNCPGSPQTGIRRRWG